MKKVNKHCHELIVYEAVNVTSIFLDICIEVFGDVFLTQKLCHGENFHHQPSFIH